MLVARLTQHELLAIARSLGLEFSPQRLQQLLPEVQRLREQADRLHEFAQGAEEPATRFNSE